MASKVIMMVNKLELTVPISVVWLYCIAVLNNISGHYFANGAWENFASSSSCPCDTS